MADYEPAQKSAAYWQRELTTGGQKINDALDKHEQAMSGRQLNGEAADNHHWAWEGHRADKQEWRTGLQQTGELVTPQQRDEREYRQTAPAPERWNAVAEASADVASDATLAGRLERKSPARILAGVRQQAREQAGIAEPAASFWGATMQAGREAAPAQQESRQKALQR
jgi:hypothetical protein